MEAWRGFTGRKWKEDVNVREFIQNNYTPYDGDESFLAEPTEATRFLWDKVQALQKEERKRGGVLECETEVVSSLTSYGPGYIDEEHKELEKIVGLQTDKPLKRAFMPYGGIKMAAQAASTYGYNVNENLVKIFTDYHKTHNQAVFDVYTPEMKKVRHNHIITGLPDTYGRGRIVGDYRRVALYGLDFLIKKKEKDLRYCGDRNMSEEHIRLREEIAEQIRALHGMKKMAEIYGYAGYEFNINSTRQLAKVLFEDLGLKGTKKTKSGYSTDSDVLEALAEEHPIVPCVIEYRQNAKLKSTYIDGLLNVIDPATSRVHSTFNQNLTATGRLSSSEPNLQNIPVRSELGKLIRKAFVPSDADHVLIDADYSQIELRVLASMSGDPLMIANFENDLDIHTSTAAVVNRVPMDMVTPQMRSRAKAVNFGIVYGISSFGLARDLGISNYAAKQLIDNYFLHYPQIKAFMEYAVAFAKDNGYAVTLSGRRRPLPELSPANKYMTRQFGERVAMNMPVQGTAADIIKRAMINVERALEEGGYKSRLILQVHDELLIDAARDEAEAVRELLAREMENCFPLKVPLKVSVSESDVSWYYCK